LEQSDLLPAASTANAVTMVSVSARTVAATAKLPTGLAWPLKFLPWQSAPCTTTTLAFSSVLPRISGCISLAGGAGSEPVIEMLSGGLSSCSNWIGAEHSDVLPDRSVEVAKM